MYKYFLELFVNHYIPKSKPLTLQATQSRNHESFRTWRVVLAQTKAYQICCFRCFNIIHCRKSLIITHIVTGNWHNTIVSTSAKSIFSFAPILWYCAESPSDIIGVEYCIAAFVTYGFCKNFRRAVNLFCASALQVSLWAKQKFSNKSCESTVRDFIDLKMA